MLSRLIELQKEVNELYKKREATSISERGVHLRMEEFIKHFGHDEFEIKERGCDEYPYEVSKEVDGVLFFAITDDKEKVTAPTVTKEKIDT